MSKLKKILSSTEAGVATIAMVYLAFGLSWILFSDAMVQFIFSDANTSTITMVQTYKGLVYIVVTTLMLLALIANFARKLKLANEQQKNAGAALQKILDEVGSGIAQLDIDGRFLYVNPDCCDFFGKTEAELKNITFFELTHPNDLAQEKKLWHKLLQRETNNYTFDKRFINSFNQTNWAQEKVSVVEDSQRDPKYMVLVINNINDLKNAEKKLEDNIRYYQSVLENSFDGVSIIDLDGTVKYQTPTVEKIIGYPKESRVGGSAFSFVAKEDLPKVQTILGQLVNGDIPEARTVVKFTRGDNQTRYLDIYAKSMLKDPLINGIVVNFRDITDKFIIENKLIESEEQYKLLFLHNPVPVFIYNTESLKYLLVNDAAVERYGYSKEEFLTLTLKDIRPKEDIQKVLDDIAKIGNGGQEKAQIWRHLTKDGQIKYVEISAVNIRYKGQKARMSIANDVTDMVATQENIRQSEERYRHLVENLPAGAVLVKGNHLYFNKAIAEMTGYNLDEINTVDDWFDKLYGKDSNLIKQFYEQDRENNFAEPRTVSILSKEGVKRWATFYAYSFETGEVWLVQDITERKKMDELIISSILETENRERKRIAEELHDGLGHLLVTANILLQSISDNADKLDDSLKGMIVSCHATVQKAIDENRSITENLTPLGLGNENITKTLGKLFENFERAHKIKIKFTSTNIESFINQGIGNNLYRIAQEALNNVLKHANATEVSIVIDCQKELIFSISDNGIGFNADILDQTDGTGFVNIANRVKAMGGTLDISSQPSKGTSITIQVPLQDS